MTFRAVVLGFLLGVGLAGTTHFVSNVVLQPSPVFTHLPVGVFGTVMVLVALNPVLVRLRLKPLRAAELAVTVALALSVCSWPGKGLMLRAPAMVAHPAFEHQSDAAWRGSQLLSYVPDGHATLAMGHVKDWRALAQRLRCEAKASSKLGERVCENLSAKGRRAARQLADGGDGGGQRDAERSQLLTALNDIIERVPLVEKSVEGASLARANRAELASAWPQAITPQPSGSGVILAHGRVENPAYDRLATGGAPTTGLLDLVPWQAWWPTLRLWGAVILCITFGSLCLVLVVSPQWIHHEKLSYPIVRFVREITEQRESDGLPLIFVAKLFWVGFGVTIAFHAVNGLSSWFPGVPSFPTRLELHALDVLFPNARHVPMNFTLFEPRIILMVIGFSFFLPREISLSLGLSSVLWSVLGAAFVASGVALRLGRWEPEPIPMFSAGAWAAAIFVIVYLGRHYYQHVVKAAVGMRRDAAVPRYAPWAAWGTVGFMVLAVLVLSTWGGLEPLVSVCLVVLIMGMLLVQARMSVEAGVFFIGAGTLPITVLWAWLGPAALGPSIAIVVALTAQLTLRGETIMPFLANAAGLGFRARGVSLPRLGVGIAVTTTTGLIVAAVATLVVKYRYGLAGFTGPSPGHWAGSAYEPAVKMIADLQLRDTLTASVTSQGLDRLALAAPDETALLWFGIGFAALIGIALARLRFPGWPLHPVLLLYFGQYPAQVAGFSFLLGWLFTSLTIRLGGARGYHAVRPLAIGLIAGELIAALVWICINTGYFALTGQTPPSYSVFPF